MSVFSIDRGDPLVKHSGTFTGNPLTMHAGYVSMGLLTPAVFDELARLGALLREGLERVVGELGIEAYVEGEGSLVALVLNPTPIRNYRELVHAVGGGFMKRIEVYQRLLLDEGLSTMRGGFVLSTPMDDGIIEFALAGVRHALQRMRSL
jgi:glutamate-1-semialdehyde 2,1-aminomutase